VERTHAYFSPTKIDDAKKDVLTLTFDAPSSASEMKVQLLELDADDGGGEDDVIAVFEGKLVKGKFKGRLIRKATPPYKAPTFQFQFAGDSEVHTLAIPSGRGEKETGAYEIGLQATRVTWRKGKMVTFDFVTKTPALIRSPEARTIAEQRPVVAFLAGSGDAFYTRAEMFWEPISDHLRVFPSLEEIVDHLNRGWTEKSKDGMELGAWGQVNIVTHANEEGWTELKLFSDDERGAFYSVIQDALLDEGAWEEKLKARKLTASSLERIEHKERRQKLQVTSDKIDDKTSIVFRGCNVGRSPNFLKIVRKLLKDKPSVSAPKYLQTYQSLNVVTEDEERLAYVWEWFQENFYFDVPWRNTKTKPSLPKAAAIVSRFKKTYPGAASDKEWKGLVDKGRHDSKKPLRYAITYTTFDLEDYEKKLKEAIRSDIDEWNKNNEVQRIYEEYAWKISKPVEEGDAYVIKALGTKYRIEVRRPLKDAEGKVVVPDLSNTDHYGKEG
jgi:hypothetical protein